MENKKIGYIPIILITLFLICLSCHKAPVKEKINITQNKAPEFSLPNQYGEIINLSDFKGENLLIDFWASWCSPCRSENKNIVKLYEKYNSKGLSFLSISLDGEEDNPKKGKENWINAIQDDKLVWTNVSELKGWGSEIVKLYKIKGIPYTVLIDKNGNIIAKNLLGEELENEIKKILE